VDRVNLMWHSRRTNLTRYNFLLEIIHGNVGPYIPCKISQYRVYPFQRIAMRRKMVIVFNLRGILRTRQAKLFVHEFIREGNAVHIWIGHVMRIVVSGFTAELSGIGYLINQFKLIFQSFTEYQYLLSKPGRRGWLAMRAG